MRVIRFNHVALVLEFVPLAVNYHLIFAGYHGDAVVLERYLRVR